MSTARIRARGSVVGATNWVRAGAALFGAAWGSNQFTPMLLVYRRQLGLSTGSLEALFGVYALGLIPGLLIAGPLSDARGRRPVILASAVLSLAGTLSLVVAAHSLALLFVGRFLTGLGSGAAFGAGTAWLRELSRPPLGDAGDHDRGPAGRGHHDHRLCRWDRWSPGAGAVGAGSGRRALPAPRARSCSACSRWCRVRPETVVAWWRRRDRAGAAEPAPPALYTRSWRRWRRGCSPPRPSPSRCCPASSARPTPPTASP